jgi:site-specific DNA-methyltransferase (adenine-specific)
MAVAIEDAGFEIRDQLAWVYGSGFPQVAQQPGGWGTALKPSWEPICLGRKPLDGTVAANMAKWGTGALNIDGCRIDFAPENANCQTESIGHKRRAIRAMVTAGRRRMASAATQGRWPANLCHDGSDEVVAGFPAEAVAMAGGNPGGHAWMGGAG